MIQAAELDALLEQYPEGRRENLVPILQAIQSHDGYLSPAALERVCERLRMPLSKVFGIATYYNQFRFQTRGKVHCQVCRGTGCHVHGSAAVLDAARQAMKIEPGKTSRDGMYSLEVVTCLGACGLSPAMVVNGECHEGVTPGSVRQIIESHVERVKGQQDDAAE